MLRHQSHISGVLRDGLLGRAEQNYCASYGINCVDGALAAAGVLEFDGDGGADLELVDGDLASRRHLSLWFCGLRPSGERGLAGLAAERCRARPRRLRNVAGRQAGEMA